MLGSVDVIDVVKFSGSTFDHACNVRTFVSGFTEFVQIPLFFGVDGTVPRPCYFRDKRDGIEGGRGGGGGMFKGGGRGHGGGRHDVPRMTTGTFGCGGEQGGGGGGGVVVVPWFDTCVRDRVVCCVIVFDRV